MHSKIIGISSYSGGGKTTLVKALVKSFENSAGVFYDDYDDYIDDPPIETWHLDLSICDWKMPRLGKD